MDFDHVDLQLLNSSLGELLPVLQDMASHNSAPLSNIKLNRDGISSLREKLKTFDKNPNLQFSLQELKYMYWAVFDLREKIRDYLDCAPLSDPDREQSLDTQKRCNRLLRKFSAIFSQQGIDIKKWADSAQN